MASGKLTFQDIQAAVAAARARRAAAASGTAEPGLHQRQEPRLGGSEEIGRPRTPPVDNETDIPPLPRADAEAPDDARKTRKARRRGLLLPAVIVLIALAGFGGAVWWGYRVGTGADADRQVPLIMAEAGPEKIKPQDEGGLEVPNQEKLIYNEIAHGAPEAQVERLLPEPETPMAPPAPTLEAAAPAEPAAGDENDRAPPDEAPPQQAASLAPAEPAAPPTPSPPAAAAAPQAEQVAAPSPPEVALAPAPEPVVAAPPPASETAAPTPPAETKPAAPAKPPVPTRMAEKSKPPLAGKYRIQLGAFKTAAIARGVWARLQRTNPGTLGGLQPHIELADLGSGGRFYRLQAGPMADKAAATSACARLQQSNQPCIVVRP